MTELCDDLLKAGICLYEYLREKREEKGNNLAQLTVPNLSIL